MRNLDERARQAQDRKATLGEDIDLDLYGSKPVQHEYLDELSTLSEPDRNRMILSGMDIEEKGRSGTFIQKDSSVLHARSKEKNVEVIPIKEALEQYDWVKEQSLAELISGSNGLMDGLSRDVNLWEGVNVSFDIDVNPLGDPALLGHVLLRVEEVFEAGVTFSYSDAVGWSHKVIMEVEE